MPRPLVTELGGTGRNDGYLSFDSTSTYPVGTLQEYAADGYVNALSFLSDDERSDVVNRVGSMDVTASLARAIAWCWTPGGASSRTLLLPRGIWRCTLDFAVGSGVSIEGDGTKHTIIKPQISSGAALSANVSLYNQTFRKFTIDGTGSSGTARAINITNGNRTKFDQVNVSGFTGTSVPAMLITGAGYQTNFYQCNFSNNLMHWKIQKGASPGDFPTAIVFDTCIFEGASLSANAAMQIVDCSAIKLRDCIVQANDTLYTLEVISTVAAGTNEDPMIEGGWWEDNGGGQANSIGIYFHGSAARTLYNPTVRDVAFHQGVVNKPTNQIFAEWTDGMQVTGCTEGFGAGATFIKNGGNNSNYTTELSRVVSTAELMSETLWASGVFNGIAGISVTYSKNCTITRTAAGSYLVTFTKQPPIAGYLALVDAEQSAGPMVASPGTPSSTASFSIATTPAGSAVLTDARTVSFRVTVQR